MSWKFRAFIATGCLYLVLSEIFCFCEVGPLEVGPLEVGPLEGGPLEVGPLELSLLEVGPLELSLLEVGPLEVGPLELSPLEVGPLEISSLKIGKAQRCITHIYPSQPCVGKRCTEEIQWSAKRLRAESYENHETYNEEQGGAVQTGPPCRLRVRTTTKL